MLRFRDFGSPSSSVWPFFFWKLARAYEFEKRHTNRFQNCLFWLILGHPPLGERHAFKCIDFFARFKGPVLLFGHYVF